MIRLMKAGIAAKSTCDDRHPVAVVVGDGRRAGDRDGGEGDLVGRDALHAGGEVEQVQPGVGLHRRAHGREQLLLLGRVEQRARRDDLVQLCRQEVLLAHLAVEVTPWQAVPLTDEGQGLLGVERRDAGRQVDPGVGVARRVVQAHLERTQRLGDVVEAEERHPHEVVDGQAGHVLQDVDQQADPAGVAAAVRGPPCEGRVELAVAVARDLHPGVTGEGDRGRCAPVCGEVQQQHGVGVDPAAVLLRAELVQQRLAGVGGPVVIADQQDVESGAVLVGDLRPGDAVDTGESRCEVLVGGPGVATGREDGEGEHRRQDPGQADTGPAAAGRPRRRPATGVEGRGKWRPLRAGRRPVAPCHTTTLGADP